MTTPAPQTPMEAAMTVPTASSMATGKTRKHRMMRRSIAAGLKRDHTRQAELASVELICTPFWRWRKRAQLEDRMLFHRDRARMYSAFLGEPVTGGAEPCR